MNNKYSRLGKNTIIFAIGNFSSSALAFILLPILTNYLTAAEYGKIDFLLLIISLLVPVFSINFTEVIIRFGLDKKYKIQNVIATVIYTILLVYILTLSVLVSFYFIDNRLSNFIFIINILFLNVFYELLKHYIRAIERIKLFALGDILYSSTFFVLSIIFICNIGWGIKGYIFSYILSNLFYIIIIIFKTKLYINLNLRYFNKQYLREFIKYSVPLIPNNIFSWIINVSDRILIKLILGFKSVGIYSVANKIPQIITTFYSLFFKAWQISSIKELGKENTELFYSTVFKYLVKFLFGLTIFGLTFLSITLNLVLGKDFREAIYYIPILLLAINFYCFSSFFTTLYTANKKTNEIFKGTLIAALINIIINILLIKKMGVLISCISTLISYLFLFIYRYINSKKLMKLDVNLKEIFSYCCIVIIMIVNLYIFNAKIQTIYINFISIILFLIVNKNELKYIIGKVIGGRENFKSIFKV